MERSLVEYCLNSELIVLRNEDDLYLITLDLFLFPSYEVSAHKLALTDVNLLEEVDGDGLVGAQIGLCINCEEVETLPLALVLGSKLLC